MMTNKDLLDLLAFEQANGLKDVEILSDTEVEPKAHFVMVKLYYQNEDLTIPFIKYDGEYWLFPPCDWQGWTPDTPAEIDQIDWRVNDSSHIGTIFSGLPRLITTI